MKFVHGVLSSCCATQNRSFSDKNWALDIPAKKKEILKFLMITLLSKTANIYAVVTDFGRISFYNEKDELLLKEYYRCWEYGTSDWKDLDTIIMQRAAARTYRAVGGDNYALSVRFEADDNENSFGMGQYQQPQFDLKGCTLELASENTLSKRSLSCI